MYYALLWTGPLQGLYGCSVVIKVPISPRRFPDFTSTALDLRRVFRNNVIELQQSCVRGAPCDTCCVIVLQMGS
eukprot:scaffold122038_cov51-Attheya_sp.AAC.2